MLQVTEINMHCSKCEWSGYRLIPAKKVKITLDLEEDEYIFESVCPTCGLQIINKRPM